METWREELYHHGILGMRWGVRRYQNPDGSLTPDGERRYGSSEHNKNYSDTQRKRDKRVYSRGAVRRINRRMNYGESIQSARSAEANRIQKARKASSIGGTVGRTAGAAAGGIVGMIAAKKITDAYGGNEVGAFLAQTVGIAGGAAIGAKMGRYMGESVPMLLSGYDPAKNR